MLFTKVLARHYEGDDLLEQGVMAEFDGKPNSALFKEAMNRFQQSSDAMGELDQKMTELIQIHKTGTLDRNFEKSLNKILRESDPMERPSLERFRYSNVAKPKRSIAQKKPRNLLEIMEAQQADLRLVKKQLDETIEALRNVLPLAEKGEFAAMMLSGRHGFSDKVQQSVHLIGLYSNFYTRPCMATIDATMQAFPSGLEWLKDSVGQQKK